MKAITISFTLLLAATLNAAPAEDDEQRQPEVFDLEFALPEYDLPEMELPELQLIEKHEFGMFAFADEDRPERDHRMDRHAGRIQLYRLWRIMEELDLTDDQVDKFFPLMREMGKREKELAGQRRSLVKGLREELNKEEPAESKLKQMLADLKRNASQAIEIKNETIDKGSEILSIEQQARMVLELHEVERNIWESIARVRHMPSGRSMSGFGFDKQSLELNMNKLRENLHRISRELEAKGLPGLDMQLRALPGDSSDEGSDKDKRKDNEY